MKNKLTNRILSLLLSVVMVFTILPMGAIGASATTYTYDADAAITFAQQHCSGESQLAKDSCNKGWLCAEFVANCLKAGGFNISGSTAKVNAKAQGEYMQKYGTKMAGNVTGNAIHDHNFVLPLKKGDLVYVVYDDTVSASGHALIYSGEKDSSGNLLFYAHNNRKEKETYAPTGKYLSAMVEMYAIIMNNTVAASMSAATEVDRIKTQITNTYSKALSLWGKSSFDGWCGSYVQYQLRALEITSNNDTDIKGNGNKMYTNAKVGITSKGYTKTKYSGNDCLTNLVNANDGKNVYNIYVSWTHQYGYTDSNPGAGHVTFIHAILDNIVYYSESYDSSRAKEGEPQSCSVSTFMSRYNNSYGNAIGAVHFVSNSSQPTVVLSTNPDDYTFPKDDLYFTSPVMVGNDVAWVQAFLYQMGYSIEVDKSFGPTTKSVVAQFQRDNGLTDDGSVGPKTRAKMAELWNAKKHTVCTWNSGVVTTQPTCTANGVKTYTCTVCNATKTESIGATGHSYGSWGNHSSSQHKQTCTKCGNAQYGNHTWNSGVVTTQPTCTANGVKTYTCTVCNATKTESIGATGHSYGTWGNHSSSQYKQTCTKCGNAQYGNHSWNSGVVTTQPTCTANGVKTYTCTVCNATKTESIGATGHSYGSWGNHSSSQHKQTCSKCGDVRYAEHIWNDGVITKVPTCFETGITTYTCTACGVSETTTLIHNSNYGEWVCCDEETHNRVCTCGNVEYEKHAWDNGVITKPATTKETGIKTYTCQDCGVIKEEKLPIVYVPGDINGDGVCNNKDVTRLMQYYAKWDVEVNEAAMDVNGDGVKNNKDVTRLMQYLAKWDVEIF